jgi:hypothetical protein
MRRAPTTSERPVLRAARRAAALVLLALLTAPAAAAAAGPTAPDPIRFTAALGVGARLGGTTSLAIGLAVQPGLPLVTEVRVLTPAGIDLSTSGLGMATCERSEQAFLQVWNPFRHHLCPENSLMGVGRANAELRFDPDEVFDGAARIALYSAGSVGDKPGLLILANAVRPVRLQLSYRGYIYVPPPGFGVGIALQVNPIPRPPFNAPVALSSFRLVVGDDSIRYVRTSAGHRESYAPRTVPLPHACPAKGFRFRAIVRLLDGRRLQDDAVVRCPPAR